MTQHFLITGANRGLGAAITRGLAASGCQLTLLCRDRQAAEALIRTLPSGQVSGILQADLSSLRGIQSAIHAIKALPPLDGLIHNAAIWPQRKIIQADGLEEAFVVNHLAPFLMNMQLEDRFQRDGTRVVQMTAGLYPLGDRNFSQSATGQNFSALKTYASTKLLNLATTMTFAERWQGSPATINAVHPGVVRTDLGAMSGVKGMLLNLVKRLWLTPEEGARAPLSLCTDPAFKGINGRFYDRFKEAPLAPFMQDTGFREAVWQQALQYMKQAG
ncbi:SDR family NAD(P)-dependent oxidoreductase [Oligoflexus tunisiensis]|uniref:SDR family NAD(P)-dependent oxidoreductase n=1 Tax=Oligoflexus tunisiensis TaxID=708132 RepID=UPI000A4CCC4A|nr:SDR family NAD(P)-dependent oxidoreductase [Oligoflexus tunisiensis]